MRSLAVLAAILLARLLNPRILVAALVAALAVVVALTFAGPADARLAAPSKLRASWDGSAVHLSWRRVRGARSYRIRRCVVRNRRCVRSPRRIARVSASGRRSARRLTMRDARAPVGVVLGYRVTAVSRSGREGGRSRLVRIRSGPSGGAPQPAPPGPRLVDPPPVNCTTDVASAPELTAAVSSAPDGTTVCVRGGTYPAVTFDAARTGQVIVAAKPGEEVTFADIDFGADASHIRLQSLHVNDQVALEEEGAHHIEITWSWVEGIRAAWGTHDLLFEHNDITGPGGGNGIELVSQKPNPGSPDPGAQELAPVERVTIRGNRLHDIGTDAIMMNNYKDILVEDNEITGLEENGQHTDALQSVWGGERLTFRGNYVHDNHGQGFFIKDGRAWDVVVDDNLIVRTRDLWQISFYDCVPGSSAYGIQLTRNTVWDSNLPVDIMGTDNRSVYVHNNVFEEMLVDEPADVKPHVNQAQNLITGGWNWGAQPGDSKGPAHFVDPGSQDWRLSPGTVPFDAGVTWRVADKHFGP
jgi:hypothetical protein